MCGGEKRKGLLAAWRVGIGVGGGVYFMGIDWCAMVGGWGPFLVFCQ